MKILNALVLAILASASVAHAQSEEKSVPAALAATEISFTYSSFNSYYTCSYVESLTESVLIELGAENIEVDCTGGLPDTYGNFVTATFSSWREVAADKSTRTALLTPVSFGTRESCDLYERIVTSVLDGFQVYAEQKSGACWDSSGTLSYSVTVLR